MTEEEIDIYFKALQKWGTVNQMQMLFEEMAELQDAVCKILRHRANAYDVITEIADVQIMAGQMQVLFGIDEVEQERKRKLERLKRRLGEHKEPTEI